MKMHSSLELLETRIAPAAVIHVDAPHKTITWSDADGDLVTLKWSGATTPVLSSHAPGSGVTDAAIVDSIALQNDNDAVTLTVTPTALGGDGRVDLGYINATGHPLKSFSAPKASVLEFDCGDGTHAIGSFSIAGYGTLPGSAFSAPGGDGTGTFKGAVGTVRIAGDIDHGGLDFGGSGVQRAGYTIGSITVTGSLHGQVAGGGPAGYLETDAPAGAIKISGSLIGGSTADSGELFLEQAPASLTIAGDVIGGSAAGTGIINQTFALGKTVVSIAGSVVGGSGDHSGYLSFGSIASLTIGGDLHGGSAGASGEAVVAIASKITVKGSIIGGSLVNPTVAALDAGGISVLQSVGSIAVGHNLIAGTTTHTDGGTVVVARNGAIAVNGSLGSLSIGGSIEGNNATRAFIVVLGTTPVKPGNFNALGKLTVGGSVNYAIIATGQQASFASDDFTTNMGNAENPDAGLGSVSIGGDFEQSSIMAGTNDLGARGVGRATNGASDDTQSAGDATRHAILGPVVIKGAFLTDPGALDYAGFEAEQITKITAGGITLYNHGTSGAVIPQGRIKFLNGGAALAEEITPT